MNETTLRNWVHEHLAEEARAADPLKVSGSEFEELRRLRAENAELKMEKEILREAAAHFARVRGFELLATGQRPHFTVRLMAADDPELAELLAALGPAQPNPQYAKSAIWREEG